MKTLQYFNQKLTRISFLILTVTLFFGCGNVLDDVENLTSYPEAGTFDDISTASAFLNNLYGSTLGGWPFSMGNICDESGGIIDNDWVTTSNSTMKFWPYSTIRKINILLEELPLGKIPPERLHHGRRCSF